MDILVLGGAGQVGLELQRLAPGAGLACVAPVRGELDLTDTEATRAAVASRRWACVINTAAYTAVDKAESDAATAWALNAEVPGILAAATAAASIPLVHVSTDYVFDGSKASAYEVDDPVAPLGVYGASKEAGERAVRAANPRHAVVRTSWVVSPHRSNFVKTMLRLAGERPSLRVVDDQVGTPTVAADLAGALLAVARRLATEPAAPVGTFHFANAGATTWCGLARETLALSAARGGPSVAVEPIATSDYPTPARRPANSRLSTARITADYGIVPRDWRVALADVVEALVPGRTRP